MKLIVVEEHKSNYPNPISFKKGESLIIGKKDTEFEDWIWVTTKDENQGWAPMQYLQIEEGNKAVAKQDYTATELDTCLRDELFLHGAFLRQCLNSEINYTTSRDLIEGKH